jgi:ABC-type amino acid transport system permease subunit
MRSAFGEMVLGKSVGLQIFFLVGICGVLLGVFAKSGCLIVVFGWWRCGGSVVKRGVLAVAFWAAKNAPRFVTLFLWFPFWEGGDCSPAEFAGMGYPI